MADPDSRTSPLPKSSPSRVDPLDQYIADIGRHPLIDDETEARLARGHREGDPECLDRLVLANLRFVVSVAKRYQHQGVPLPDLISEGNLGLIRAAQRFDETRGVKFISYAVWWIRQAILQVIAAQARVVRIPVNRATGVYRMAKRVSRLQQATGREVTEFEVARDAGCLAEDVADDFRLARPHLSLDAPLTEGTMNRLRDWLPDRGAPDVHEQACAEILREHIDSALATLSEREAKILRLYYALDDQPALTLKAIAVQLGLTHERVRQIREHALERLRHPSRARFLEDRSA